MFPRRTPVLQRTGGFFRWPLTKESYIAILYLLNKYGKYGRYGDGMEILISNSSDKPIYEQIYTQIKRMIMDGTLQPGEMLPSMRALSRDLHLSVITVQRAYEDLTRDGFLETVSGKGCFVALPNRELIREEQLPGSGRTAGKSCGDRARLRYQPGADD